MGEFPTGDFTRRGLEIGQRRDYLLRQEESRKHQKSDREHEGYDEEQRGQTNQGGEAVLLLGLLQQEDALNRPKGVFVLTEAFAFQFLIEDLLALKETHGRHSEKYPGARLLLQSPQVHRAHDGVLHPASALVACYSRAATPCDELAPLGTKAGHVDASVALRLYGADAAIGVRRVELHEIRSEVLRH